MNHLSLLSRIAATLALAGPATMAASGAAEPSLADPAAARRPEEPLLVQPAAGVFESRPAIDFIDSVGVCAHLGRLGTNYFTRFNELEPLILELGIRHIRNNPVIHPAAVRNVRALGDRGIRFLFNAHPDRYGLPSGLDAAGLPPALLATDTSDPAYVRAFLDHIKANFAGCTEMLEGLNEPDRHPELARAWMRELRRHAKADPVLGKLPLLGSALAVPSLNGDKAGDWIPLSDLGNVHAYPSGRPPEFTIHERIASIRPQFGYLRYVVTETGYHGGMNNPPNKNEPTPDSAQAIYMPRLYLEYFRLGIVRSYKYQLLDDRTEDRADGVYPKQLPRESHFGLIDYHLRPKPAYFAIKNLLAILRDDPGASVESAALSYAVEGAPDLRHVLLRKSTGVFFLALWRTTSVWDPVARRDLPVASVSATLRLEKDARRVRLYRPTRSAEPMATLRDVAGIPLPLEADVIIAEIETS